jgi:hypothetical protein
MQAAEVAAEIRRMRGRKPKSPQNYEFDAALNVRPPFSSWRIGNACRHAVRCSPNLAGGMVTRLPRHPWRLPDYREPLLLLIGFMTVKST